MAGSICSATADLQTSRSGCLPGKPVLPLQVDIGRFRYRSGFVARRSAEDMPPFRALEQAVRDIALGRPGKPPTHRVPSIA